MPQPTLLRTMSPGRLLAWAALLLILAVTLMPLWLALKTALVHPADVFSHAADLLPVDPTLVNFRRVLGLMSPDETLALVGSAAEIDLVRSFARSFVFTGTVVLMQTACAAMSAYAFARLRFRGRDLLFMLFVGSMMLPSVVTFIPNFILVKELGWLDTMAGMAAPFALMQGFSVFFLRQFFLSLPRDLEEAALLEGASHWRIFWHIALPLSVTPLATIATLTAINMWNEFFWPYLVARGDEHPVLPVVLQSFRTQRPQGQPDWTGLMAAATLAALPAVLLLLAFGRRVVDSIQFTAGK
ncbi:carbohydrate ABC transporter permease [Piscinibacter sp.]|uniref:carbohydrate ABC transporter permease n=1 Tax=Piscinibacter sp. TaxID=1903157 RepID=UPI002CEEB342|nr:carbohydrate ABC transporter permease [Albitalea sp.]HUG22676.1 carbohydrate ABC transporter permease [Albitalea sp.]